MNTKNSKNAEHVKTYQNLGKTESEYYWWVRGKYCYIVLKYKRVKVTVKCLRTF